MKLLSYLIFNGEAEDAALYYAYVLGGEIGDLYRYDTMPATSGISIPDECKQRVSHCCIIFPGGTMSVSDSLPNDIRSFGENGHMLTLHCDSIADAETIYTKLAEKAQRIICEPSELFFAKRYAEVVDRYGVLWAIIYAEK